MMSYDKNEVINAIQIGISDGKKAYSRKRSINHGMLIFLVFLSSFTISVNMSDAFASSLIDVPIIGKIVEFVRIGSGFEEVAKQGLYTEGEILVDSKDYFVNVEGYYYSDYDINMFIGFTGVFDPDARYIISDVVITDINSNKITEYSLGFGDLNIDGEYANTEITINKVDEVLPEELIIKFSVIKRIRADRNNQPDTNKKTKYQGEYLIKDLKANLSKQVSNVDIIKLINHSFDVDGMIVEIESLKISPTTMNLKVNVDSNTMKFYDFGLIQLKSEDETYPIISSGTRRSGDQDTGMTYYFESSFFDDIDDLELQIDGIYALPIDNSTIVLDLENVEMLKSIDDKLNFSHVGDRGEFYDVYLQTEKKYLFSFSEYNKQNFASVGHRSDDKQNIYVLEVEKSNIVDGIIEVSFWKYPNIIKFKDNIMIIEQE